METRYASPYVAGILYRVNPIDVKLSGTNARGEEIEVDGQLQPRLEVELQHFAAGTVVRATSHKFTGTEFATITNGIGPAWEEAFHDTADQFPVTHSQPDSAKATGIPFVLRCDQWKAIFRKDAPKQVELIVGVYDASATKAAGYINLSFVDGQGLQIRSKNRAELQSQLDACQSIIDGTSPVLESRTPEDVAKMKAEAVNTKAYYQARIDEFDADSKRIGELSALLSLTDVQSSIGLLCARIFGAIKASDPAWADIDLLALMQNFQATFATLLS